MRSICRPSAAAFLAVQSAFYLLFLYRDLADEGEGTIWIKYTSIALCLLASAYWSARGGDALVTAALAFTLGADTFLLLLNRDYPLGVLLFCVVQGLYLGRICRENGGKSLWPVRLGLFILALFLLRRLGLLDPLTVLSLFYFTNFVCNALLSLTLRGWRFRLFSLGLLLFLCCDLCVAVFNQPGLFPNSWYLFARVGMWLFYLPAQVLIALSGLPDSDAVR